jgi:hypothetical protein
VDPLIPEIPALVLDHAAAMRAWNWVLVRQGLADSRRLTSAVEVADAALGLHAARLPSPFAIVAARTGASSVPLSLFTEPVRQSLLTVRCMRKTLHALPLPLAAAAHAATLRFRERDALRAVRNAGHAAAAIDGLIGEVHASLGAGPLPYRVIESLLGGTSREVPAIRLAIKVAWERGSIAYINATSTWNRESRTFALTTSAYPALDLSLSRDQAVTTLVTAYFHRYGPATIKDATWWSGLSATDITTALARSGRQLAAVSTPWSEDRCLMFADQVDDALGNTTVTGVQFLAHEDSALKAYHPTRARYLADVPQQRAFNQIGEALPSIIINGHVAGTWSWDTSALSVRTRLLAGKTTTAERHRVRARAIHLTRVLRAAWAPAREAEPSKQANALTTATAIG